MFGCCYCPEDDNSGARSFFWNFRHEPTSPDVQEEIKARVERRIPFSEARRSKDMAKEGCEDRSRM